MKIAKRIFLFVLTNIMIVATISVVLSLLGVGSYLEKNQLNYGNLAVFCLVWGFGGAFISLAISRIMAKWMMGVQLITPDNRNPALMRVQQKVYELSRQAGLPKMPEVGYYDSPDLNAFATGPTKSRALVAVSTGLLNRMSEAEVDGVLAHEVAHIANGDMVTMTLVQGVVNAFVMFFARIIAWGASQAVEEERRPMVQFGVTIAVEILLGFIGMMVVAAFSRAREFRADAGGAKLAGAGKMISALEALKQNYRLHTQDDGNAAIAAFKISGKPGGFMRLFSTHPDLDDRIAKLKSLGGITR